MTRYVHKFRVAHRSGKTALNLTTQAKSLEFFSRNPIMISIWVGCVQAKKPN
jgi:hypothetical protein